MAHTHKVVDNEKLIESISKISIYPMGYFNSYEMNEMFSQSQINYLQKMNIDINNHMVSILDNFKISLMECVKQSEYEVERCLICSRISDKK